jgi:hypothetical protein
VIEARATGENARDRKRTIRVVRYADSWDVILAIAVGDPNRAARASAELDPKQARAVAHHLPDAADRSEQAHREAEDAG